MIPADMRNDMHQSDPLPAVQTPVETPARKRKGMSQERIMIALTVCFGLGVAVCVMFEEGAARGIGMTLVALGAYWVMFKGGS